MNYYLRMLFYIITMLGMLTLLAIYQPWWLLALAVLGIITFFVFALSAAYLAGEETIKTIREMEE